MTLLVKLLLTIYLGAIHPCASAHTTTDVSRGLRQLRRNDDFKCSHPVNFNFHIHLVELTELEASAGEDPVANFDEVPICELFICASNLVPPIILLGYVPLGWLLLS